MTHLKIISVAYSECVSVAFVTQHAVLMNPIILSSVCYLHLYYFSTVLYFRHNFRKAFFEHKICFYFNYKFCLSESSDRLQRMYMSLCEVLVTLHFSMKFEFSGQNLEKLRNMKFHENPWNGRRVVACRETDGRTDGQTERQTEGHTGGWTDGQTDIQTDGRTDILTSRRMDGQTDRRTYRRTDIQTDGHTDERTYRRTDGHTGIQTDGQTGGRTDRETDGQRDERMDGRTDGQNNRRMDERTDGHTDRRTD